ncbi:hypothetical protein K1T71_014377 [Dendrolimus kikuchii]|uniref:Uncharacterized protein n=1 Tax=Dendrolimus kikuchii TaxID=765133 RepID=A0ACC1CDX1_9NEOP|nr:hypothetical protein K1T71_014377 [Dendrolimus kikuchii]
MLFKSINLILYITSFLLVNAEVNTANGYCDITSKTCPDSTQDINEQKYIFYDVNPPEGFNLRRDVYMRFAIMLTEAHKRGKIKDWSLVLPPWYNLYHWKSSSHKSKPAPWGHFFDINSLKSYAPVVEMYELFSNMTSKSLIIDTLYVLQNFENAFENGDFRDKWELKGPCYYDGNYWGYKNITAKEVLCVNFQGSIYMLQNLISIHSTDKKVMFSHGEIPLHDSYGTKQYWDCRKSMKFNTELIAIAKSYISKHFDCNNTVHCQTYISVHWRRQDFARYRKKEVPSITGTALQINKAISTNIPDIRKIFIATDASEQETNELETKLNKLGYVVKFYVPNTEFLNKHKDGEIAIIEQIICSYAAFFIGTHESTFSFRIQEEREIMGFDSRTTFNRLCPDSGVCEKPAKWTIVY